MAIEPWQVVDAVPPKKFVPVHDVFQHFVEHLADVRFRMSKSWAIVKHPCWVRNKLVLLKLRCKAVRASCKVLPVVKLVSQEGLVVLLILLVISPDLKLSLWKV